MYSIPMAALKFSFDLIKNSWDISRFVCGIMTLSDWCKTRGRKDAQSVVRFGLVLCYVLTEDLP